ncbi:MAG: PA2169 family four-helix-bundle protein [Chloroflexi bacterium]|nr:PA2169 family four-helix-bundle protein [Chloroflexota bacterium]
MTDNSFLDTLQMLYSITRVSADGFREAIEDLPDNAWGAETFSAMAEQREAFASELAREITSRGGQVNESAGMKMAAALHQTWMNVRSALSANDDRYAVLAEAERGEDYIKSRYEEALEDEMPPEVRALVTRHYEGIVAAHDRIKLMRDRAQEE